MEHRNDIVTAGRCCANNAAYIRTAKPAERNTADVPVMVYIVGQVWDSVYPEERALSQGTLFPALDKPFMGKGGCCCD